MQSKAAVLYRSTQSDQIDPAWQFLFLQQLWPAPAALAEYSKANFEMLWANRKYIFTTLLITLIIGAECSVLESTCAALAWFCVGNCENHDQYTNPYVNCGHPQITTSTVVHVEVFGSCSFPTDERLSRFFRVQARILAYDMKHPEPGDTSQYQCSTFPNYHDIKFQAPK